MKIVGFVVLAAFPLLLEAQGAERKAAVGWEVVGLPALNYNSDEGFGYGVLAEIYNYGAGLQPYKYTIQPTIFLTTKGRRDVVLFFDAPHVLKNDWRFDVVAAREQQLAQPYYGIGNATPYDSTNERAPNPYYYRYEKVQLRLAANVQHRIGASPARFLMGLGFADDKTDATPYDSGTTLLASQLAGASAPKGQIGFARLGVIWDTRDKEIGPHSGTWAELMLQRTDRVFGASDAFTRVSATVRRYVPLGENVVGAVRLFLQQSNGDVPLYDMATMLSSFKNEEALGGAKSLRGIPKNRYIGKGIELANVELRWRFLDFTLMHKPMFLLLSGFVDAGRVWTNSIQPGEMLSDLHVGEGAGLRIGLGQSFVIATDFGRSSEAKQLYIALGYLF